MYEYRAQITKVVDGDTVDAEVDLGFHVQFTMRLRLFGINAPEMNTSAGPLSKAHLIELLSPPTEPPIPAGIYLPVTIRTQKDRTEKYGRYLATIIRTDGVDVNALMVADGFAIGWLP